MIISSSLPSAPAVQIQIESLPQLIRRDIAPWKFTVKKTYCFMICRELRKLLDSVPEFSGFPENLLDTLREMASVNLEELDQKIEVVEKGYR